MENRFLNFLLKASLLVIVVLSVAQIKLKLKPTQPLFPPQNEVEATDTIVELDRPHEIDGSLFAGDTVSAKNMIQRWKSEKPNIASVDSISGKITAHSTGECDILGFTKQDTIFIMHIKVSPLKESDIKLTSITMKPTKTTLNPSEVVTIPVKLSPENASNPTLIWETGDPQIATVDSSGKITAKGKTGTTLITVKATDGSGISSSVEISVTSHTDITVPKIKIAKPKSTAIVNGNSIQLKLKNVPQDSEITWTSSNPSIATVNPKTGLMTSKGKGKVKVTVTVKTRNGKKVTDSLELTVTDKPINNTYKLRYGTWHGQLNASGRPHGDGYVVFTKRTHVANTNDGEPIYAEKGKNYPAYFQNGEIVRLTIDNNSIWNNFEILEI